MNAKAIVGLLLALTTSSSLQAVNASDHLATAIRSEDDDKSWERFANSPLNETADKYTDISEEPTTSRSKRSQTCGVRARITNAQREEVVKAHNTLRRAEHAAGMAKMVWDEDLARIAQQWGAMCIWDHGMMEDCQGRGVGQNMMRLPAYSPRYSHVMVGNVVKAWWKEKKGYDFDRPGVCKETTKHCVHYSQVVWSNSQAVGCSLSWCPVITQGKGIYNPLNSSLVIVCNYRRKGNILNVKPYVKGMPCTRCSEVVTRGYVCKNKLCVECDPTTITGCTCVNRTCEHGTFSATLCKCICTKGYYGRLCDHECVCTDKSKYCSFPYIKSSCDKSTYAVWLKTNCPRTCPKLCRKPPAGVCP